MFVNPDFCNVGGRCLTDYALACIASRFSVYAFENMKIIVFDYGRFLSESDVYAIRNCEIIVSGDDFEKSGRIVDFPTIRGRLKTIFVKNLKERIEKFEFREFENPGNTLLRAERFVGDVISSEDAVYVPEEMFVSGGFTLYEDASSYVVKKGNAKPPKIYLAKGIDVANESLYETIRSEDGNG